MATYDRADADIAALFYKVKIAPGKERFVRLPYNLITYDDGFSALEPVNRVQINSDNPVEWNAADEGFDRIEVLQAPPFGEVNNILFDE